MHKQLAFSLVAWSLPRSALQLSIACAPEHSFHLTGVVKFMHIRASARPRELHTKCEEISHSLHLLCEPATAENILAHTKRHSSEESKRRSWWHRQNLVQFFVVVVILHLLLLFFLYSVLFREKPAINAKNSDSAAGSFSVIWKK